MPEGGMVGDELKQLAEQKEQEWRQLQQLRLQSLESSLEQKEKELSEQRVKFNKLKEDFKYNLKLLNERHAELDNYDKLVLELRSALSKKEGEISDIKIRVDAQETAAAREAASRDEMARHYQQRVREKQAELDSYRALKDQEVQEEREKLESSRRTVERRVLQLEEELATQKQELTFGFEEAMRQREHEFRKQADEMSSTVLAHELKVKLLAKELEVVRAAADRTTAEVSEADSNQRTLQKKLKRAEWELHDVTAIKDAKISELEGKLDQTEKAMKRMQGDFARRREELDKTLREREACLSKVKESGHQTALSMTAQLRDREAALEEQTLKVKELEWKMEDVSKDKDSIIQRLQLELKDAGAKFESHLSESTKDTTARDMEVHALRDSEAKLKTELTQRKADIDRYKRELSAAIERQSDLERAKAQQDLDWQHRYDDVERQQYERSEELVKGLTRARDEAQAELTEKQRELSHCEELIKVLTADRNLALTTLRQHGIPLDHNTKADADRDQADVTGTEELVMQNENLRAVIRQMRTEMETLGKEIPANQQPQPQRADRSETKLVANEYVKNLEKELKDLKSKLRKMQHDLKHGPQKEVPDTAEGGAALVAAGDNMVVKTHIEALNNTIGTLRREKTELMAHLRKQQARTAHLESGLSQLSKQPLQKQATIEQLQYELSSQQRRHTVEVAGLKGRVADLELQLTETRKEADEYYKASIERNLENTALGNEISKMKMDLADKRPAVNYGAQELVIQQLQDEIERLRKTGRNDPAPSYLPPSDPGQGPHGATERQLHAKLRQAAKHISQLARDKKHLIEMGNRLRAQLYKAGLQAGEAGPSQPHVGPLTYVPAGVSHPGGTSSSGFPATSSGQFYTTDTATSGQSGVVAGLSEKMKNKLIQLEKLQYELTKQKLANEQRDQFLSTGETDALSVSSGSVSLGPLGTGDEGTGDDEDEEYRPPSILKKSTRDPPVKLSPVPEDTVPPARPRTAPPDTPRPESAMSDSFRPATSGSVRGTGNLLLSMSSVGGESLAEVWKLLDEEGVSPRPFTPLLSSGDGGPFRGLEYPGDAYDRPGSSQSFTVRGSQPQLQPKPRPQHKPAVNQPVIQPAKKPGGKKAGPKPKVRNYNLRDDR